MILQLAELSKLRHTDIADEIRREHPNIKITTSDVSNETKCCKEKEDGFFYQNATLPGASPDHPWHPSSALPKEWQSRWANGTCFL